MGRWPRVLTFAPLASGPPDQNELWMQEVSNVHQSVRKSLAALPIPVSRAPGAVPAVDMAVPSAKPDAITLPIDTAFYALDFEPTFLIDLAVPFAARALTPTGIADGFAPITPPRFVAPPERITLPVPVYEEEPGVARVGVPRAPEEEVGYPEFVPEEEEPPFDLGLEVGVEEEEFPEEPMPPLLEPTSEAPEAFPEAVPTEAPPVVGVPPPTEEPALAVEPLPPAPPVPAAPRLRPPRKVRILEDAILELTDDEIRTSRRDYEVEMESQRLRVQLRERHRQVERAAHAMIFGPPSDMAVAPALSDFWSATIGANLRAVEARFRAARREALPAPPAAPFSPPPAVEEEVAPPSPGVALGIEPIEVPRGFTPTALARREAELPWQVLAERRREESISAIAPGLETISDIAAREFAVETPTGLRRIPRLTPIRRAPSISLPSPGPPSIEGFELGPLPSPAPSLRPPLPPPVAPEIEEGTPPSVIFDQDLETETANFLEYAKAVHHELEDSFLFFSDLAPVASSSPSVAAQAFYHVLTLVQRRRLRVKQDEAYGEIEIQIVE
ncbi:R8 protein [Thecaphora frezii]